MPRYSTISLQQLKQLNDFALSDAPSAKQNLTRLLQELGRDSSIGGLGMLSKEGAILVTDSTIPHIRHYAECEAMLEFPAELQHPAEQVSVCISLLTRLDQARAKGEVVPMRVPAVDIQRRLSHLLVEYPVLMDPRVRFAVKDSDTPDDDWVCAAAALARLSFASLPSQAHGLTPKQLRLFAGNASVAEGLKVEKLFGRTAKPVVPGATRGAFLLSALHLNQHRIDVAGRDILGLAGVRDTEPLARLYRHVASVVMDVACNGGALSGIDQAALIEMLQLRSPLAKVGRNAGSDDQYEQTLATTNFGSPPLLLSCVTDALDEGIFGIPPRPAVPREPTGDQVLERTRAIVEVLTAAGLFQDTGATAMWLKSVTFGPARRKSANQVAPSCSHDNALSFLEALHQQGVTVTLAPLAAGDTREGALAHQVWSTAADIFTRKKAMEQVFAAAPKPTSDPSRVDARRARRIV